MSATLSPIEQARERLAGRYRHAYHKNAIQRGEWDGGSLIAAELDSIERGEPATPADPAEEDGA